MSIQGEFELLANVDKLEKGFDRRARKAVKSGGELFLDELKKNTPVSNEDHSGLGPLVNHAKTSGVSIRTGNYSVSVGYDNIKGRIAHFPNSGTSKQDPQHFVEKTQAQTREKILQEFIKELKV